MAEGSIGTAAGSSRVAGRSGVLGVALCLGGGQAIYSGSAAGLELLTKNRSAIPPPATGERVLSYFKSKDQREKFLAPLDQDFRTNLVPAYGQREARLMYLARFVTQLAVSVPWKVWLVIIAFAGWLWNKSEG